MMNNEQQVLDYCLDLPDVYEDNPYEPDNWTAVRRKDNKKVFAFVYRNDERWSEGWGKICVSIKCTPEEGEKLRKKYRNAVPACRVNKKTQPHWCAIILGGDVHDHVVEELIKRSYELVKPRERAKRRDWRELKHPDLAWRRAMFGRNDYEPYSRSKYI